jgi:hypothetical protein
MLVLSLSLSLNKETPTPTPPSASTADATMNYALFSTAASIPTSTIPRANTHPAHAGITP